jgi:hypothetical protein
MKKINLLFSRGTLRKFKILKETSKLNIPKEIFKNTKKI